MRTTQIRADRFWSPEWERAPGLSRLPLPNLRGLPAGRLKPFGFHEQGPSAVSVRRPATALTTTRSKSLYDQNRVWNALPFRT